MEINVFRKGIPPECVHVRISKNSISIKIELPGEEEVFEFQTILFGEVSACFVLQMKLGCMPMLQWSLSFLALCSFILLLPRFLLTWQWQWNYVMDFSALQVDVDSSSFKVLSTKLEVRLRKFGAFKWPTLEKSDQPHVPASGSSDPMPAKSQYPTSSLRQVVECPPLPVCCSVVSANVDQAHSDSVFAPWVQVT